MKAQSFLSMLWLSILLTLATLNHTEARTHTACFDELTKNEALTKLRNLIGTITNQFELRDEDFRILTEDQQGLALSGTATFFGIKAVPMQVQMGNTLVALKADFPAGASAQIQLSGQNLNEWLPSFMRNNLDLRQLKMDFYPKEDNRLELTATLAPPVGAAPLAYQDFRMSDPNLIFRLTRAGGTTTSTTATAELGGALQIGALHFQLAATANTQREWVFIGILNQLKISDLVRNIGSHLSLTLPPMLPAVEQFTIQEARIVLHSDRSARLTGKSDIGNVEAFFTKPSGQPANFLLGFAPNTNYKLAKLNSALQPIDNLGLNNIALIYAAASGKVQSQDLELLSGTLISATNVRSGLTLVGGFQLPANLPGLSTTGSVLMRAHIPPTLSASPSLQAAVQFNGLQLGNAFRINEAFLQVAPADMSFGAGLNISANLDGGWLNFTGMGDVAPPATFGVVVFMDEGSIWRNPFGIKGVEIANLGLDVGADVLSPIPRPKLGVSGALKIGPFQGAGAGMLDTGNPLNSLISMQLNQISMQEFANAFLNDAIKRELNKLPATLRDFGLRDVEMTLIPKTTEMAGRTYTQGLRLAGKGNIAGLGARLDVNAGFDNGYRGEAVVSPIIIREGNLTIFRLSGNAMQDSARMAVDFTYQNLLQMQQPILMIDGRVELLGMSSQTKVEINRNGFYFYSQGKLFNKFEANLDAKGGNVINTQDFFIRAAMKNELISYMNQEATKAIDQATKASQDHYRKAKADLSEAEDYLRRTQKDVDAFNAQKAKVDAAQRDVNKLKADADKAKRDCDKAAWYRKADLCAKYAAIKGSYETATGVLSGYKKTLDGLGKAVDWSKRNIAANTVAASRTVLDGFDKATTGSMKAAKWIVDKGLGGVIDVKSAEFTGQLNTIKGGQVAMKINTKFLNESFNAGFTFNFNDPVAGAKALADMLLNDRAPKGYAPEIGRQIGTRY
ncbi:MAG TPA: hypothetical protein PKD70_12480 [Saprospiraceae bacterium]|nr:hypothetical protein [Saprospiraceae bacterium]